MRLWSWDAASRNAISRSRGTFVYNFLLFPSNIFLIFYLTVFNPRRKSVHAMFSQVIFLLAASVCLCNANPLNPSSHPLLPRDDVTDCQNVTLGLNSSCWDLIPRNVGMESWLRTWNETTTICKPGERWANCFMRESNMTSNTTDPIRCDLIGPDLCPQPILDITANTPTEVIYGAAAIWGKPTHIAMIIRSAKHHLPTALQQYMTSLYQFIGVDPGAAAVQNEYLMQKGQPRSVKPILIDILNLLEEAIATNLTKLITNPTAIGQPTFQIPTEAMAPQLVGQTIGYLLQHTMTDWASGNFTALTGDGNLIEVLANSI